MMLKSIALFIVAGLCEIGGGWLVWKWMRDGWPIGIGLIGGCALMAYGVVAALQPANFGRVYAAYGGVFIVMSLAWGWLIDGHRPDRFDLIGAACALLGVAIMMYAPRNGVGLQATVVP